MDVIHTKDESFNLAIVYILFQNLIASFTTIETYKIAISMVVSKVVSHINSLFHQKKNVNKCGLIAIHLRMDSCNSLIKFRFN